MTRRLRAFLGFAFAVVAGCGGAGGDAPSVDGGAVDGDEAAIPDDEDGSSPVGSGVVAGNLAGTGLDVADCIFTPGTGPAAVTFIELTPYADACALKTANVTKGDATTLSFLVPNDQMTVGRHAVTSDGTTLAEFSRDDASCMTLHAGPAYDGSVTLTEVSADAVSGDFDLWFSKLPDPQYHITGSFHALLCPSSSEDAGLPTCE